MKKSDALKKLLKKNYQNGGRNSFTRPEGWEKKLKRSHFDPNKSFSGEDYEDIAKKEEEKSGEKKKKDTLDKISEYFKRK